MDREPTDWLASNGRWYPARHYPNGWNSSALPPAPGHGRANSILQKYASAASGVTGLGNADQEAPFGDVYKTPPAPRPATESEPPATSDRSFFRSSPPVAKATVTSQRTYAHKVGAGAPPAPALSPPPPPGRVRSDAPDAPGPRTKVPGRQPPPHGSRPASATSADDASDVEVTAGDLGAVFGSAKKRIEKALNDAYEG